ncbi:pentatricopeptide repeat-containing protein At3g14730 isoform X1 [Nymphaea colorata]|uniref:Pentacotripeptide-repeat region of PRORP domain-containing protein n=1 Tax=Nymphaea colorata TaxID=210225 RepID=A0A5K0X8Q8_9MAGN|nr:pentatricopeptide repeat-containing protein At3g14730 isoform X1 [Nymphaea colorata]
MSSTILRSLVSQPPNSNVSRCVSLLQSCAFNEAVNRGQQAHSWIIINGLQQIPFLVTSLINMYSKCHQPWEAVKVFRHTIEPNVFAWNALIAGLVHGHYFSDAVGFYHEMKASHVRGDKFTYPCVLKACTNLQDSWEGKKVHAGLFKGGLHLDAFISASLINFYLKFDAPDDARQLFDKMTERDVVLWNSMISGYAQSGRYVEALEVFRLMEEEGIELSKYTATGILSVLAAMGDVERGRKIHSYVRDHRFHDDVVVCNSLIDMYGKCKSLEEARQVFDEMPQRDMVSWNSIISCYSQSVYHDETLLLFDEMRASGFRPDAVTITAVLPSCAHLAALKHGREIHGYTMMNAMGRDDVFAQNAIMDMYVKCGSLRDAQLVFDNIPEKDLVSWNIMITGYGMHGYVKEALEMFEGMQMAGMMPDEITFVGVLSACSHAGFFDCGVELYRQMQSKHGVVPTVEHYACTVDMLGRAGRLHEAYSILQDMHIEPNPVVWRAFLGACRLHGETTLGEVAARRLLELDPEHCGNYVLLSNIYSDAGRYEEVSEVRREMKSRGVKKMPGCSWIELDHGVHAFITGLRANPGSDQIYELLHVLMGMLREHGYEPDVGVAITGT